MSYDELPALAYADWEPTKTTLHLWCQIVGKIRMASTAPRNHWWNVTLYLTPRGLSTRMMRYEDTDFEIEFDFIDHRLAVRTARGIEEGFKLRDGLSVAGFYKKLSRILRDLEIGIAILAKPYGVPITTPFAEDEAHASYDRDAVERWWKIARWSVEVFESYAADFGGKASPAHLFWHSFDLAMSRYSGRPAPERPGVNHVEAVAYSHEVIAVGFWPGDPTTPNPAYYTYTAPEPPTLTAQPLAGPGAMWAPQGSGHLGVLPYESVRTSAQPEVTLLEFLHSGYQAGVTAANWPAEELAAVL